MVFLILFFALFFSCTKNTEEVVDVYARVGKAVLTNKDVLELKKDGLVEQSSIRHLVESWVEKTLFYNEAVNISLDTLDLFFLSLLSGSRLVQDSLSHLKQVKLGNT